MDLLPLLSSFIIVAIAEFGDKTQIAVVSLSAKHTPRSVFTGALLAFALVDGISALIGGAIAPFIPTLWINLAAGITFITFGVYTLLTKEAETVAIKERGRTITTSFLLISIMELGDKTQFAVIALAADYGAPLQVFIGIMLAFTLLTALAAGLGSFICRYVSSQYVKIGAALIFIIFGLIFLTQAFTGIRVF